ncbi:alpha/beta hydrolase [Methyloligella solikamskensis]|uniref:Alpha/beta hydrolase n=1 Tax=Methyloligella solikamskensis TaxID=1177756 RepID=A0ABW3JBY3_9HYPH
MRYLTVALILCVAALPLRSLAAAETYPPVTLEGTQQRDMTASGSGETFRIFIRKPQVQAPEGGYPVVYAIGANANFLTFVNLMRTGAENPLHPNLEAAIIVGIGFPTGKAYDVKRWIHDFTLPAESYDLPERPNGKPWPPMGGADETLDFIENDLKPAIERDFEVDASKEILFGHSFGGLFTLHTLFTRPGLFDTYLAASPSVWFNEGQIMGELESFVSDPPEDAGDKRLVVGVGGLEKSGFGKMKKEKGASAQSESAESEEAAGDGMIANAETVVGVLQKRLPALKTELRIFPEENHGTVLPVFIMKVLPDALPVEKPRSRP